MFDIVAYLDLSSGTYYCPNCYRFIPENIVLGENVDEIYEDEVVNENFCVNCGKQIKLEFK